MKKFKSFARTLDESLNHPDPETVKSHLTKTYGAKYRGKDRSASTGNRKISDFALDPKKHKQLHKDLKAAGYKHRKSKGSDGEGHHTFEHPDHKHTISHTIHNTNSAYAAGNEEGNAAEETKYSHMITHNAGKTKKKRAKPERKPLGLRPYD